MKVTQEYSDKTAISLSLICLAHCLLVPILLVLFSGYVTLSYNNELIHYLLLLLAIPVSFYALFRGMKNHSKLSFFVTGLLGIIALIFAVTISCSIRLSINLKRELPFVNISILPSLYRFNTL